MANAIAQLADPLSSHLILDEAIWQTEPKITVTVPVNPAMPNAGGPLITAPDLASLAEKIAVPAGALAATVAAYNDAVASGEFRRAAGAAQRAQAQADADRQRARSTPCRFAPGSPARWAAW